MADQGLTERSAFSAWKPIKSPNISIDVRENQTLASIAAARGKAANVAAIFAADYGVELPATPACVSDRDVSVMWAGPDQWIVIADRAGGYDLERELKPKLAGIAAVVDQSDARVIVRIAGPRARTILAKGLPIDLHPRAFKTNDVAITHASHIGVIVWQVDDAPTFDIAMFRSFADSFTHWLRDASAEYLG